MQQGLIQAARRGVPRTLGCKYANAVVTCLTELSDEENGALRDKDGVLIGSVYVTKVVKLLEEISI